MADAYVAYYRVSTEAQQRSGWSLVGQRLIVRNFIQQRSGQLLAEFQEQEAGHKSPSDRPALRDALAHCRRSGATLLVAKLDRLARSVLIVSNLMESGVNFVAADMPLANRLTIHILAAVAEYERRITGARIRDALAAYRERGGKIGFARMPRERQLEVAAASRAVAAARRNRFDHQVMPIINEIAAAGATTCAAVTRALNRRGIPTYFDRGPWYEGTVAAVIRRVEPNSPLVRSRHRRKQGQRQLRAHIVRTAEITADFAKSLVPLVDELRASGFTTWRALAQALDERGIKTRRDAPRWDRCRLSRTIRYGEVLLGRR